MVKYTYFVLIQQYFFISICNLNCISFLKFGFMLYFDFKLVFYDISIVLYSKISIIKCTLFSNFWIMLHILSVFSSSIVSLFYNFTEFVSFLHKLVFSQLKKLLLLLDSWLLFYWFIKHQLNYYQLILQCIFRPLLIISS